MKKYLSPSQLKDQAKRTLAGQYHNVVSACFMVQCLTYIMNVIVLDLIPTGGILWYILNLLVSVILTAVAGVFQVGLSQMFLSITAGQPTSGANIFYGFRTCSELSLKISFLHAVIQLVCIAPAQLFTFSAMETLATNDILLAVVAYAIGLIVYVPLSIMLSQCYFLVADFPNAEAKDIIRKSIQLMKKHFGKMLRLVISFIPLLFVCFLTFGIGMLWLIPYRKMTYAYFFLDIMNDREA